MDKDFQIINGERWPLFPFYVKSKISGFSFLATYFKDNEFQSQFNYVEYSNAMLVSVTEIEHDRTVPTPEKKYRPWERKDVKNILFFKDMIFRNKTTGHQYTATVFDASGSGRNLYIGGWRYLEELFEMYEYSYDCETWLKCGKEIQ